SLYVVLARRGHFALDPQVKRKLPRLALSALLMGAALLLVAPFVKPFLTGALPVRGAALAVLVGAGVAIYAVACFVTGAYRLDDLRSLLRRRATTR
ncbi:MAG: murein biosynthesis integral membrane protein MurJ, partial [Sphingomonas sp.]